MAKGNILICADGACATGFAQVTHNLVYNLWKDWNLVGLLINHHGDSHPIMQYMKVYCPTAKVNGDVYGFSRIEEIVKKEKIDLIFIINDPWVAAEYLEYINALPKEISVKKVLYTPVDATNLRESYVKPLNEFDQVIAYTEFGKEQLELSGLEKEAVVVTHGVDTSVFYPIDKRDARQQLNIPVDWYIVQCVNRNSLRKRIDLAMYYFAEWVHRTNKPNNVKFYYHGAVRDEGIDPIQLAKAFQINDRVLVPPVTMTANEGVPIEKLRMIYNSADVHISMSVGEGFGLTVAESMACRIPNAVPNHSAFSEWPKGGVEYFDLLDGGIQVSPNGLNTIGRIASMDSVINVLEKLYQDTNYRKELARKGYKLITKTEHDWKNIAKKFSSVFSNVLHGNK